MEKQKELISKYVSNTRRPTFKNFTQKERHLIEKISISIETSSPLYLQREWVKAFNTCIRSKRPEIKLQERPSTASLAFKRIFEIAEETRKAAHDYNVSSLQITGSIFSASRQDFLTNLENDNNNNKADNNSEDDTSEEEECDREEENKDEGDERDDEDEEESQQHEFFERAEITELEKLSKSSCVNLLNSTGQRYASETIPKEELKCIRSKRDALQAQFTDNLSPAMYEMINIVFDELKKYRFDFDLKNINTYLDCEKNKETDKESDKYILLSIVSSVVNNFRLWKKEDKLSENTYLRKFADIVDVLFQKTNLFIKDGENVCEASKRMQIINEGDTTYGRRLDLIVLCEQGAKDMELCSLEFKKGDASFNLLFYQQCKNLRINACILNDIHLMTLDNDITITYMDFSGRNGYISQIFKVNDYFVAHEVGKVVMIKSALELEILRDTTINLFKWKQSLVNNSNIISLAYINQCNKYTLSDISNNLDGNVTPPRTVKPAKIFLSPSKDGKRSRTVFENDY